ncbi:response regulator transcription factor [Aequorivita lipolytica]|uniref:Response regulator transcription factor n=1 Tax=Aequorivita lipolytica TaxID=153267 RepID=A0A5C6YPR4_9FLAO|nr:response regulator transcription factor [Aequorivita lipolytica]TXD68866.1 response regulator transcription factor [Aequorivita lipolytica]SRX52127.1 Transcriptional regulatory protein DegU [Aequorivita lipolytica]
MSYSVVVVDDHFLLSQAIGGLVQDFENFRVLYLCKNGRELLDNFENPQKIPDLVLMDIKMPILNGIETTEILKKQFPNVKVLALSIEEDEYTILKMLRAGACGYLMKDTKKDILEEALLQVMENGRYYTNTVSQILVDSLEKEIDTELKEKEIEFIKLACTDMNYKEIADKMCCSYKTVEGYRDSVHKKLKIKNRIGLVLFAIHHNLFTP